MSTPCPTCPGQSGQIATNHPIDPQDQETAECPTCDGYGTIGYHVYIGTHGGQVLAEWDDPSWILADVVRFARSLIDQRASDAQDEILSRTDDAVLAPYRPADTAWSMAVLRLEDGSVVASA